MKNILLFIFIIISAATFAQEICNNAIDDDYDGFIDLNDEDCICDTISLIPNPSFEDTVCLPSMPTQMSCAQGWIQASFPTSDYWHQNGATQILGLPPPPQPLPNGSGYVGFLNNNNWQEYIGSCLINQMQANVPYNISFSFGFGGFSYNSNISEYIQLTFYGIEDCAANLPFGDSFTRDCPANYNWDILGTIYLEGMDEWIDTSFTFTPTQNYDAFILGPDCINPTQGQYYYLDNLILNQVIFYQVQDIEIVNIDCNNFELQYNNQFNYSVQWYKNGIALVGETADTLLIENAEDAIYSAILDNGQSCIVTNNLFIFEDEIPEITIDQAPILTVNENTNVLLTTTTNSSNFNLNWLPSTNINCNTCNQVEFTATENVIYTVEIFDNETLCTNATSIQIEVILDTLTIDTTTIIIDTTTNIIDTLETDTTTLIVDSTDFIIPIEANLNCEIYAPNIFTPNNDGINDFFEITLKNCNQSIIDFNLFNRFGERINTFVNLNTQQNNIKWDGTFKNKPLNSGVFVYVLTYLDLNNKKQIYKGNVTLLK